MDADDLNDDDDSDDDAGSDDDEAELMAELQRIKRERAQDVAKKVRIFSKVLSFIRSRDARLLKQFNFHSLSMINENEWLYFHLHGEIRYNK